MLFTGTDSDYSVEDYLNAVTANLMTNKHHIRNQPHYSEDEEYYHQNQQRFKKNQQNNKWNIDHPEPTYQPDLFEPNTRNEQTRQRRQNPTSYNKNVQSQNPVHTQNYQPTKMRNEITLTSNLQQHEITKTQLTYFSQIRNAAESLQMTMNLYIIGGSAVSSNKPLMIFTGTDSEYSVEDYLNAVTANLMTNQHHIRNQPHYSEDEEYYHQINKTINGTLINQTLLINQTFSNHMHETNKDDKQDRTQRHIIKTFNHKTLYIHKIINQPKCGMKSHYHKIYNNMK